MVGRLPGRKASAHAGPKGKLSLLRDERGLPLEHVEELVLARVAVEERRLCPRSEPCQIHAEGLETEEVAEWPLSRPATWCASSAG